MAGSPILGLQRAIGNQAVQRLLRDPARRVNRLAATPGGRPARAADRGAAGAVPTPAPLAPAGGSATAQRRVGQGSQPDAGALPFRPVAAAAPVGDGYIGWPTMQRQPAAPPAAPAADVAKATTDLATFQASNYAFPNFTIGLNGKFDVNYQPVAKTLNITVKVGFKFFDDPADPSAAGKWTQGDKDSYAAGFLTKTKAAWNDRYTFSNVREPKEVWKKLNPVHVNLSVVDVSQAGKIDVSASPKGQHFLVQPHKEAATATNFTAVGGGKLDLFKGDDQTQSPFFQKDATTGEMARMAAANPSPILFDHDSFAIKADIQPKLVFLAEHLRRINQPKFDVKIVGHASSVGQDAYNLKLSEKRAKAVEDVLKANGVTNHTLLPSATGEVGAMNTPEWRKVVITPTIQAGYVNAFDTFPHEFGHMIGMDDEYQTPSSPALTTHYDLVKKAFGQKYADLVAKRGASGGGTTGQSANVMDVGQDVRIYDYVTFWSALAETTLTKAAVPTPKFGYDDWKFNE
jgi:outer membrane protein OmpA-like peptidoglycan-associated protein